MGVKVVEDGVTVSLLQGMTNVRGRDVPLRKSVLANAGTVYRDDQVSPATLKAAKAGDRGLEVVSDEEPEAEAEAEALAADVEDYSDSKKWPVEKLEEETLSRELEVTGTGSNGNIVRADLEKALTEDDARKK